MKRTNYIKAEFPSSSVNEAMARSLAAVFASRLDPTLEELGDIKTAVSEAVTNAIVHAYPDSIGRIFLRCSVLEEERLEKITALGIGPQGLGGRTTALAVNIETMPTHIAGLPVAVNINCHVTRHQTEVL